MVSSGRLLNKIAEVNMDFPVEKLFGGTMMTDEPGWSANLQVRPSV